MREYLQRQSFLGKNSDQILQSTHAAISGLCGGGSHIAQQLSHIGVGEFSLFDFDEADETNRNRMVGLHACDAKRKRKKTEIIKQRILQVNPDAKVNIFSTRWQENADALRAANIVFGAVDSFLERDELERYARRYLIPYIDVGMDVFGTPDAYFISGQVIMSLPDHPCMWCMGFLTEEAIAEEQEQYGQAGSRPQVVWPNGTLASVAVGKFMSLVTPWNKSLQQALYTEYDGNRNLVFPSRKLDVLKDIQCPHFRGTDALGDVDF
jgi:molybdopterin-synthase adenylyltransferase